MSLPIYERGQARDYCQSKGWQFKTSGDHLVLKTCPVGGHDGDKFYINDSTGLWDCKTGSCGQKGNFYQLKKFLGDVDDVKPLVQDPIKASNMFPLAKLEPYQQALLNSPAAQAYLTQRGISTETATRFHLGFKVKNGIEELMIPYIRNGYILDIKYRLLPSSENGIRPKYSRMKGGESILFGEDQLTPVSKGSTIYLVEGEMDAMTLWQHGYYPALSTTTGASSFKTEWYDIIKRYEPGKIILVYDSDAAGQLGAEKIRSRLLSGGKPEDLVVNLVLPDTSKDINDYFLTHSGNDFKDLVDIACLPKDIENVNSQKKVLDDLESLLWLSTSAFEGLPSQFPDINAMVEGGYWNGQLVVITGPSGTGKTSLVLQEMLWLAEKGEPCYLLCLEMPEVMMERKIFLAKFGIPMLKLTHGHVVELRPKLENVPLFLGSKCRKLADVERTIRQGVSRYDLKVVAFDNINYFIRSIEHQTQEIAACTKLLKDLAVELNIPIIAIAQPKKFDRDQRMMTTNDLAWSSAIEQDADTIIMLHRKPIKTELHEFGKKTTGFIGNQSPFTMVRVAKARYAGGGETYLYFDGARSSYRELTNDERTALENAA